MITIEKLSDGFVLRSENSISVGEIEYQTSGEHSEAHSDFATLIESLEHHLGYSLGIDWDAMREHGIVKESNE